MERYKGYPIYGAAIAVIGEDKWYSQGIVFHPSDTLSPVVELKRVDGPKNLTFAAEEEAERHGLELCKVWIDEQNSQSK